MWNVPKVASLTFAVGITRSPQKSDNTNNSRNKQTLSKVRQQGISKGKRKDEALWFDDLLPSKSLQMRRLVIWHAKKEW